jgi:hypothetical protein
MGTPHNFTSERAPLQVAGIFEFVGSIALGGETTKTIASDISNVALYKDVPEIYM